jgi:RNA polymerase sigma-70 factor (ECF subfamily)
MAEEIVQDALLRVWIHAPRWRPQAAFRTWLYRIVVNLCLNAKRRPGSCRSSRARVADRHRSRMRKLEQRERDRRLAARSRRLPRASAPRSCSPIRKGSAMPKPRRCSSSVSAFETLLVRAKRRSCAQTGFELRRGAHDTRS